METSPDPANSELGVKSASSSRVKRKRKASSWYADYVSDFISPVSDSKDEKLRESSNDDEDYDYQDDSDTVDNSLESSDENEVNDTVRSSDDSHSGSWIQVFNKSDDDVRDLNWLPEFTGTHRIVGFENLTPFQCFEKFLPDQIFEHLAMETNKQAESTIKSMGTISPKSRYHLWKDVSVQELKAVIAVEIAMGMLHKTTLACYFHDGHWLLRTPGFSSVFTRDRYLLIRTFLPFFNKGEVSEDDYMSGIMPFVDAVNKKYTEAYSTNRELCVDETMSKFKPSRKWGVKWGLKVWSVYDAHTGFLLKFNVIKGKDAERIQRSQLGYKVVLPLLTDFKNKGHIVFMDKFFSSVALFHSLREKNIGACGTIHITRCGLPIEMKTIKQKFGDPPGLWENREKNMLVSSRQDVVDRVTVLSTVGNAGLTEIDVDSVKGKRSLATTNLEVYFNKYMEGVCRFNELFNAYPFSRRTRNEHQTIWYFILEVAMVNAYICYSIQNAGSSVTHQKFRELVIDGMLEGYRRRILPKPTHYSSSLNFRLTEQHFVSMYKNKKQGLPCKVCTAVLKHCKLEGKGLCRKRRTNYFCNMCPEKPPLCAVPCFKLYHTEKNYEKSCQCN